MDDAVRGIIETLGLVPHPEGGFYREVHRSRIAVRQPSAAGSRDIERSAGTSIYYLLPAGDSSRFHRLRRNDETWLYLAGDPLELHLIHSDGRYERRWLTDDLAVGEPQTTVASGCWQAARVISGGSWCLCACIVFPGFEFETLELPTAGTLARRFPQHAAIIRDLCRR